MIRTCLLTSLFVVLVMTSSATAQVSSFGSDDKPSGGARMDNELTQFFQVGMIITAGNTACRNLLGTAPVPTDWPEQTVTVAKEEMSGPVKSVDFRIVGGTVRQMVVSIPLLPPGQEAKALVTYEVKRRSLLPPQDTTIFVVPDAKKLKPDVRQYLGPSPYIESNHGTIKNLAKELTAGKDSAWEKVEAIYDGVRERVQYVNGPLKGALQSLKDGTGDCEELSSLFIACCRASGVPARIVWVPGHCYPEFYLEDEKGTGYWLPCQAAGNREFGGISEHRPILQKGDNFQVPERPKDRQRYVAEYLTGSGGSPGHKFIREMVSGG